LSKSKDFTCYLTAPIGPAEKNELEEAFKAQGRNLYDPLVVRISSKEVQGKKQLQAHVYLRGRLVAHSAGQEVN
jgi:hypothetical protein